MPGARKVMVKFCVMRGTSCRLIVVIIAALSTAIVFTNTLTVLFSSSPSSSVAAVGGVRSLSANIVRVEAPDRAKPGSNVHLVLSVDAADIPNFLDVSTRRYTSEIVQTADDKDILMHNPQLCNGKPLDWVVYVHTSPTNWHRRQLLRDTWANLDLFKHLSFRIVFLLGKPPPDSDASSLQVCVSCSASRRYEAKDPRLFVSLLSRYFFYFASHYLRTRWADLCHSCAIRSELAANFSFHLKILQMCPLKFTRGKKLHNFEQPFFSPQTRLDDRRFETMQCFGTLKLT